MISAEKWHEEIQEPQAEVFKTYINTKGSFFYWMMEKSYLRGDMLYAYWASLAGWWKLSYLIWLQNQKGAWLRGPIAKEVI